MTESKPHASVLVAGSANVDFVIRAPHIPAPGETVLGRDLTMVAGGKGANQAVTAARAGGADTAMLVALGNDVFAPLLETSLTGAGITLHRVRSGAPTGAALICVSDNAENAITVAPGANMSLRPGDLPDLTGIDGLLLQLETPLPTVIAYARAAHAHGVRVILNASPAQLLPAELLAAIDVLVVNEDELSAIGGAEGTIAEQLARLDVPCVVATLGARGACARSDGQFYLQPAVAVTPVDTTAAGDTFCGVLAASLCAGESLATGLSTACAAAGLAATRMGAQSSIPTRAEVEAVPDRADAETAALAGLAAYCGVADIGREAAQDRI
ncbi:MAG: ribokinase [Sphingosinicella sp.]|nr:ribokinase [Sphingosinicella sp.]